MVDDLISELRGWLSNRTYLIILDDVWTVDLWNQLKYVLPDDNNGSLVLMTSRSMEVAKSDEMARSYKLNLFDDEDSLHLLLEKALPDKECPSDLVELAQVLCKKCEGLPVVLIALGGMLSTKEPTYSSWERVLQTINQYDEDMGPLKFLVMSYEDMPSYLKICFLYLALFPEDYEISVKRLIRMWIAEGFIPHEGRNTMEQIAQKCMEQLVQRCMVQVSMRSSKGLIKYCQVHDLFHYFAIHEARKENFIKVFSKLEGVNHLDRATRRASLQSCSPRIIKSMGPKTRSLLWFGPEYNLPNYSKFRLLRVLEIVGDKMFNVAELKGLEGLTNLKYLGFRNCPQLIMPHSFGHFKYLETLDLRGNLIIDPPTGLWTIDTLRHVLYDSFIAELPSSANLRNLQTIQWVCVETWHTNQLPRLTNLRKLGLSNAFSEWDVVLILLGTLPSLISLGIRSWDIPMEIVYPRTLPNYQNLQSLHLEGYWSESVTLDASSFPPNLLKLTLVDSKLGQDPMLELGKLQSLKKLQLKGNVYKGKQMICPEGFPVLQSLVLDLKNVEVLMVAEGVMSKLEYLTKSQIKLEMPPQLKPSIRGF